jgi:hypothetical protein
LRITPARHAVSREILGLIHWNGEREVSIAQGYGFEIVHIQTGRCKSVGDRGDPSIENLRQIKPFKF